VKSGLSTQRFSFLGVPINATNTEEVLADLLSQQNAPSAYICFPDSFVIREANRNASLLAILSDSRMTLPDGKPSQWFANCIGLKNVRTVSGFHVCKALLATSSTHYFYGGSPALLETMAARLKEEFADARILGMKSPPMLTAEEISSHPIIEKDFREIAALQPQFIWIGISSPKQDLLMQRATHLLSSGTLLGIGGVFNYLAFPESKSPEWMKRWGLRWLYRAIREPRRLAGKYMGMLFFITLNMPRIIADILQQRRLMKKR
jgi:N-acetylglucosaminyldiphosphoundecaprenol N-acetyl-beta-D-mannosaminyltransferase